MRNVMLIRDLVPTIDRDIYNLCEFVLGLLRSGIIVQHPPLSQPKEFAARYHRITSCSIAVENGLSTLRATGMTYFMSD
jgi:hypothetical protein